MKYQNGAFVFYRVGSGCRPMMPQEITALAAQHGISARIVPAYGGDRAQVARAISATSSGLSRQGWLLTSIKTSQHEVVYGISAVTKDQARERVDHTFTDRVRWSDEGGNGAYIEGQHAIAQQVDAAYQAIRGRICPGDWTASLTEYLLSECHAQAMRDDGRIYYVPSASLTHLAPLGQFLQAVGISLVVCEIEAEAVAVVQQAASEGLAEELERLQAAVASFDGEQKPSNYKARIEEMTQLRARAGAYQAALGIATEQVTAVLDALESQVQRLLDVRENTVVHRSGRRSDRGTVGSPPADALAQSFDAVPGIRASSAEYARRQAEAAESCTPLEPINAAPLGQALSAARHQISMW